MKFKIRHKLFITIILANILLVTGIYFLGSLSFSTSFREYLDANKEQSLAPLVAAVAQEYQQQADWNWLTKRRNRIWRNLVETHYLSNPDLIPPPRRQRPAPQRESRRLSDRRVDAFSKGDPGRPKPPAIFVADSSHNLLLGPRERVDRVNWIPIAIDGQVFGYIGYQRTTRITSQLDRLFVDKFTSNSIWIVLIVIFISGIIALFQSRLLVKPIIKLSKATHNISLGKFTERIIVSNDDEIGDLCRDFNSLANSLEQNLKARQQWIADISHELRTPVSILQGELEALQDGVRHYSDDTLDSLYQEVRRLARLISDLHELSMSDIGALSYRFETVNLLEVLEQVFDSKKDEIVQGQFHIVKKINQSELYLNGDEQRLNQLFINLLNNSLAYSDVGGTIVLDLNVDADNLLIGWSDSAPGVEDEQLEKLFERLYRVESSRNRNLGGSGLGLSIVKNIVEAHSGTIEAKASELGGLRFNIRFPLKS